MAGRHSREDREAQAKVLRAVLLAGEDGVTEEDLEARCEGLDAEAIDRAVAALLESGLLERIEACLHPGGPAKRFNSLRPL
jgi:chromosome segregation and condensation protein ScpB